MAYLLLDFFLYTLARLPSFPFDLISEIFLRYQFPIGDGVRGVPNQIGKEQMASNCWDLGACDMVCAYIILALHTFFLRFMCGYLTGCKGPHFWLVYSGRFGSFWQTSVCVVLVSNRRPHSNHDLVNHKGLGLLVLESIENPPFVHLCLTCCVR